MGGFNVFGSLGMLSGFLVGGVVTDRYGFLAAFLTAGGLEMATVTVEIDEGPGVLDRGRGWAAEPGEFDLMVGYAADDIVDTERFELQE